MLEMLNQVPRRQTMLRGIDDHHVWAVPLDTEQALLGIRFDRQGCLARSRDSRTVICAALASESMIKICGAMRVFLQISSSAHFEYRAAGRSMNVSFGNRRC